MNSLPNLRRCSATALTLLSVCQHLNAQCDPSWRKVDGVDDMVFALTMWDPDGPGSRAPVLVVGGRFTEAGGLPANHIATWDPATGQWGTLGVGVNSWVRSLIALPSGDLVAGGYFNEAGGEQAIKIARWDGERWHSLGRGLPDGVIHFEYPEPGVYSLAITPSGALMAGGNFHEGDIANLATWDGDVWKPPAPGAGVNGVVQTMLFVDERDLVVGGYIFDAGVPGTVGIARWDGVRWHALGAGLPPGAFGLGGPYALALGPSRELLASGLYYVDLGAGMDFYYITQWGGAAWSPVGGDTNGAVYAMLPQHDGSVIVTGGFETAGGKPAPGLARWDGAAWHGLPGGRGGTALAQLPSGEIAIAYGGGFAVWGCPDCYADCDGSGDLTFFDFLCFQNGFAAMDPGADCDGDGAFTFFDFLCFQNAFVAGCP